HVPPCPPLFPYTTLFRSFWTIFGVANVWKNVGFNAIVYLGAMAAIDPHLYEAAEIDGAGRFKKMRYITLPGIKSTFMVLLIMNVDRKSTRLNSSHVKISY